MKEEYRYTDRSLPGSVPESAPEDGYYTDLTEAEEDKSAGHKTVMDGVPRSRGWSVASMILGILSVILSWIPFAGPILGAAAVLASLFSRRNLGYFDGMAIAGIITGAVGFVFGLTTLLFGFLFS